MAENKHALLSASGAGRWIACPPSARLEESLPEGSSNYADEGTLAHLLAKLSLDLALNRIGVNTFRARCADIQKNELYAVDMEEHIQNYVAIVMERIAEAQAQCPDAAVQLEEQLDLSPWAPESFGTADVAIIADGRMEVIDLKFGRGVPVSAENNAQLRLYGLGALNQNCMLYAIKNIRLTIVQPRLDSISSEELPSESLLDWGDKVVAPIAKKAWAGEGDFTAGEHCRFCRAKATCRARAAANMEIAKYEFAKPPLLGADEIAEILTALDNIQTWIKDVKDYALEQAVNGNQKWPGWKLVVGRSNRQYGDNAAVEKVLLTAGYPENEIFTKELLGITAMEKALGKKKFDELLSAHVIKPIGKPTLAPESDKRPEINTLAADFI